MNPGGPLGAVLVFGLVVVGLVAWCLVTAAAWAWMVRRVRRAAVRTGGR